MTLLYPGDAPPPNNAPGLAPFTPQPQADPNAVRLDLACGNRKTPGFKGVDISTDSGADFVVDLEKYPWPWKDDSVDEVMCSQYLEHVPDTMKFMNELWRVLKLGAKATIVTPYYTSVKAWQDPTHVKAISEYSYLYYTKGWREQEKLTHYPIKANFDVKWAVEWNGDFRGLEQDKQEWALKHFLDRKSTRLNSSHRL